ncbi:MAG: hypothetical protein JSU65_10235 [Candidatus Zixiibacteriota bacterium]|nr:MAG: hypothetical protein JSU65_10235 [candidate division Zixibacteria bacterium]
MMPTIKSAALLISIVLVAAFGALAGDKPTFEFDWYGYVKLDASYDQNLTSNGNYIMWVQPQLGTEDDAQFNMTHRQTRFGVVSEGKGYREAVVNGKLEFDFYGGGTAENDAALLLRHAYLTVQSGQTQLLAGQTDDLISPLQPTTLNYGALWNTGNIGYRRPQIRLSYRVSSNDQTDVTFSGGFFRTIGNDLTPTLSLATEVADGSDDGTDAAVPSFQGLVDVNHKLASGTSVRFGVSGLYGRMKAEGTLGTEETYKSNAIVGHVAVDLPTGAGFSGEIQKGANLASYLGGIDNNSTFDGVTTTGAWASFWMTPNPKMKVTAGFGLDNPDDDDIADGNRSKNRSIFGNIQVTPIPLFTMGLELSQWKTHYKNSGAAKSFRAQTSFVLNF